MKSMFTNNDTNNKTNTQKSNTKFKSNSCIKKKIVTIIIIRILAIINNIDIGNGNVLKFNKKTNSENKKKKNQMMNNKNDINNVKINCRYFNNPTLKHNKINKSNNISKEKKKTIE